MVAGLDSKHTRCSNGHKTKVSYLRVIDGGRSAGLQVPVSANESALILRGRDQYPRAYLIAVGKEKRRSNKALALLDSEAPV